jgi:hypothetical protein
MMDIVTGSSRESPLDFRANPQIRGTARRPGRRMTASKHNGIAPSKAMALHRRRIQCAVITALISIASSVTGATQFPVNTWLRPKSAHHAAVSQPMRKVTADMQNEASCVNDLWTLAPPSNVIATPAAWQKSAANEAYAVEHYGLGRSQSGTHGAALTALIRPAPSGEVTPTPPPQIPPPTQRPTPPPVAAPPPRTEQPLSPPRQPVAPPPQQEAPPPQQEGPAPEPEAPAPQPEAPAPQQEGPPPEQEPPPSPPPPRGHVRLAP